jgi:NAD(P)-dependent dehydrogenase (short-subunit alcohol dehydrogenase family)
LIPGALTEGLAETGIGPEQIDMAIINNGIKEEAALPWNADSLRRVFEVNVFGAMDTAATLLPGFQARERGHLVFITSQGRWHGMPASGSYNASKAALSLLVESLAMDLGETGRKAVRITSVEPGLIRTGMVKAGTLQDYLAVNADEAATRILRCAVADCAVCRFPFHFTLMTAALAILPQKMRIRVLGKLKA